MATAATRCICSWCGGDRPHTPESKGGCRGCWCDHRVAQRTYRVRLKIATIPKPHKDVDELLRVAGDAVYERMIEEAKPSTVWMIDNLEARGYDLTVAEGQQDANDAMLAPILSLPLIERNAAIRRLAEKFEISEDDMRDALNEAFERNPVSVRRLQEHLQETQTEQEDEAHAEEQAASLADSLGLD